MVGMCVSGNSAGCSSPPSCAAWDAGALPKDGDAAGKPESARGSILMRAGTKWGSEEREPQAATASSTAAKVGPYCPRWAGARLRATIMLAAPKLPQAREEPARHCR